MLQGSELGQRAGRREAGRPWCRLRKASGWRLRAAQLGLTSFSSNGAREGGGRREGPGGGRAAGGGGLRGGRGSSSVPRARGGPALLRRCRPRAVPPAAAGVRGALRRCGRSGGGKVSAVPGVTREHSVSGSSGTTVPSAGARPPDPRRPRGAECKDPGASRAAAAPRQPRYAPGLVRPSCCLTQRDASGLNVTSRRRLAGAGGGVWQKPRFGRGGPTWHWLPPPSLPIRGGGGVSSALSLSILPKKPKERQATGLRSTPIPLLCPQPSPWALRHTLQGRQRIPTTSGIRDVVVLPESHHLFSAREAQDGF
ncbi:gametogenetin-like [Physeter macrocephalus]|uniref:Gametogenetin-like n=1 Tax=Physeter macrocephalus TaxID=9755 RepID=A0A9W2WCJ0_PHYMC|nr:gametogenetin-like [Physeter catodon]